MANVTWIKMKVGMFDGISFKRIKKAKIGGKLGRDKLTAVWFELMDFAGKRNEGGKLSDVDDLSIMIDRDVKELKQCLDFFIAEEMINVSSDGIYNIVNWSVYQSVEEMDRIKEQTRKRVEKHRNKQKCNVTSTVTSNADVTQCNAIEEEREEEIEREEEKEYSIIHSFFCEGNEKSDDVTLQNDSIKRNLNKGELFGGVVMMSDAQFEDLCQKLSLDELHHYIGIVKDCELKGKSFKKKTHYQAILDMVNKDRKLS